MTRWNRRLLFGAAALLVPVLAGCEAGFNAPTLEFHQASNGATVMQHGITIDNAFVLASGVAGARAGLFLTLQSQDGDRLESISASGVASTVKLPGGTIDMPAQQVVNLSGPAPEIVLSGLSNGLTGGETITMTFDFAEAGNITVGVPVEPASYEYATYSPPATPSPSPTATGKAKKKKATAGASSAATGTASPSTPATASS